MAVAALAMLAIFAVAYILARAAQGLIVWLDETECGCFPQETEDDNG